MSICPWDSILEKVLMGAAFILETASSSARSLTIPLANVRVQPNAAEFEKLRGVLTLERDPLAIQGERIWHEEE